MTLVRHADRPLTDLRCPYCHDHVDLATELLVCPCCGASHHPECLREADPTLLTRRCQTHACAGTLVLRLAAVAVADAELQPFGAVPLGLALSVGGLGMIAVGYVATGLLILGLGSFLTVVATVGLVGATPTRRLRPLVTLPAATPAAAKGRCLLCPQEAEAGTYCVAHAALVGKPISSSPGARGVNPGARFGPGRLDAGWRA